MTESPRCIQYTFGGPGCGFLRAQPSMDAVSARESDRAARQLPRSFLLLHLAGVIALALMALSFTARLWGTPRYITPLSVCGFLGSVIVGALCWYAGEKWGMRECRHAGAARWISSRRWLTLSTSLVAGLFLLTVICASIPFLLGLPGEGAVFEKRPPYSLYVNGQAIQVSETRFLIVQISAHVGLTGFPLLIMAAGFHVLYFGVRPFTFRKRERLVTNRSRLPDETFAQRVSTEPELGEYLVATRKVVAIACRVDPGVIYDTHDPFELAAIMELDIRRWRRGERLFLKYLGEELGLSLGIDFSLPTFLGWRLGHWKGGGPEDFGTWALEVAKRLREYSHRQQPSSLTNSGGNMAGQAESETASGTPLRTRRQ